MAMDLVLFEKPCLLTPKYLVIFPGKLGSRNAWLVIAIDIVIIQVDAIICSI